MNNLNIRRRVYREICDKGATDWQLLGHFLIPFEKGELIYINNKDIEVRVNKILLAWEELWIELPEKKSRAWQILSGVLKLLEISIDASDFTGWKFFLFLLFSICIFPVLFDSLPFQHNFVQIRLLRDLELKIELLRFLYDFLGDVLKEEGHI